MKNNKKLCGLLSIALSIMVFTGCNTENTFGASGAEGESLEGNITVAYDKDDEYFNWKEGEYTTVNLNNGGTSIVKSGVYELTGVLKEGSVAINVDKTADKGTVFLVLNNAEIYSEETAPINITEAKKVVVILEKNTENKVVQGENVTVDESSNPSAAIFSKADLTITGTGALDVITEFNDGITSKDDIKITGGVINIEAAGDGIVGKDLLAVKTVDLNIVAGKDGMRATNNTDDSKGNIVISDGAFKINAKNDGIQAAQILQIDGGDFSIESGGGAPDVIAQTATDIRGAMGGGGRMPTSTGGAIVPPERPEGNMREKPTNGSITGSGITSSAIAAETEEESKKGLKATSMAAINGGVFEISAYDDGIHSNGVVNILDGNLNIAAGDDAIHADAKVSILDGKINITKSCEGIEGADVTIEGGSTNLVATDDGINVNSSDGTLTIGGGKVKITAGGDGIDSNGNIVQSGGEVTVSTENVGHGDSAVDYDGTFTGTGGTLVDQNGDSISHQSGMGGGHGGTMRDDTKLKNKSVQ